MRDWRQRLLEYKASLAESEDEPSFYLAVEAYDRRGHLPWPDQAQVCETVGRQFPGIDFVTGCHHHLRHACMDKYVFARCPNCADTIRYWLNPRPNRPPKAAYLLDKWNALESLMGDLMNFLCGTPLADYFRLEAFPTAADWLLLVGEFAVRRLHPGLHVIQHPIRRAPTCNGPEVTRSVRFSLVPDCLLATQYAIETLLTFVPKRSQRFQYTLPEIGTPGPVRAGRLVEVKSVPLKTFDPENVARIRAIIQMHPHYKASQIADEAKPMRRQNALAIIRALRPKGSGN